MEFLSPDYAASHQGLHYLLSLDPYTSAEFDNFDQFNPLLVINDHSNMIETVRMGSSIQHKWMIRKKRTFKGVQKYPKLSS